MLSVSVSLPLIHFQMPESIFMKLAGFGVLTAVYFNVALLWDVVPFRRLFFLVFRWILLRWAQ
jgi:hypothetical protein